MRFQDDIGSGPDLMAANLLTNRLATMSILHCT